MFKMQFFIILKAIFVILIALLSYEVYILKRSQGHLITCDKTYQTPSQTIRITFLYEQHNDNIKEKIV